MPSEPRSLLHVFSTFAVGGPQIRFAQLANHFGQAYRHRVIAMDGRRDAAALLRPDLAIEYLDAEMARGASPTVLLANAWRAARLLRSLKPDLLVTSNWGTIEWALGARLAGTPHLHMEDGFGPEEREGQIRRRVLIRRLALRNCKVVLPSRTLFAIARNIWRLPEPMLAWVPNGVDLDRFDGPPPPPLWQQDGRPVIGTVAALRAEKNIARLIHAFATVRQTHPSRLVIVGDGPERAALEHLATELGLAADVIFTGHLGRPEQALRHLDIFALSSDTEQMPLSLLEAMASGLAVAATDVGDIRAMLPESAAPYLTTREAPALAAALAVLVSDAALRAEQGSTNRQRAETAYSQEAMFSAWARLWGG